VSLSTPVENRSPASTTFAEVWSDRVIPSDPFGQIAVATSTVVSGGPTEAALPHPPVAAQRTASPPTASTINFVGVMLWFDLGIGMLGMSLFGETAWRKLRQRCNLVLNKFIAKKQQSVFSNEPIDIPN
jgi:hypothetical protein